MTVRPIAGQTCGLCDRRTSAGPSPATNVTATIYGMALKNGEPAAQTRT